MIHLVNMPLAFITCRSLALGSIKARLGAAGMDASVFNLNIKGSSLLLTHLKPTKGQGQT